MKIFFFVILTIGFIVSHKSSCIFALEDEALSSEKSFKKSIVKEDLRKFFPPSEDEEISRSIEYLLIKVERSFSDLFRVYENSTDLVTPFLTFKVESKKSYKESLVNADYYIHFIQCLEKSGAFTFLDLLERMKIPHGKERYAVGIKVISFMVCTLDFVKVFLNHLFLLSQKDFETLVRLDQDYPGYLMNNPTYRKKRILDLLKFLPLNYDEREILILES